MEEYFDVWFALWRLASETTEEKRLEEQRRLERLHTRIENLRTLFGIYEWRYAFLLVGVAVTYQHFYEGDYAIRLETRQLYVFGVRVARVLEDCGARDAAFVQVSGPSGVCLTPDEFHRAIAFEDVATAGAFMVFDSRRDYFEIARNFAHFFAHESCGFCTPCRVGTSLQRGLMDKIAQGRGSRYEVNELMRLSELMKRTSHCGLGQTAGNPFNDAWRKFRPAFEKRLQARDFAPAIDLEAALAPARAATHREDALAHLDDQP